MVFVRRSCTLASFGDGLSIPGAIVRRIPVTHSGEVSPETGDHGELGEEEVGEESEVGDNQQEGSERRPIMAYPIVPYSSSDEDPSEVNSEVESGHESVEGQDKDQSDDEGTIVDERFVSDEEEDRTVSDEERQEEVTSEKSQSRADKRAEEVDSPRGILVSRTSYRKEGSLAGGQKRTCMPDAAWMVAADLGISGSVFDVRRLCMPGWRNPSTPVPSMLTVINFYRSKQLSVFARSELINNPLGLFRQKDGVFHLVFRMTLGGGDVCKHAAVYNAASGVLKDNQSDVKPVRIEDSDRTSKRAARQVFDLLWPSVTRAVMTHVYHVSHATIK